MRIILIDLAAKYKCSKIKITFIMYIINSYSVVVLVMCRVANVRTTLGSRYDCLGTQCTWRTVDRLVTML